MVVEERRAGWCCLKSTTLLALVLFYGALVTTANPCAVVTRTPHEAAGGGVKHLQKF